MVKTHQLVFFYILSMLFYIIILNNNLEITEELLEDKVKEKNDDSLPPVGNGT